MTPQSTDAANPAPLGRVLLKLSGEAPCNICYYIELEFGHFGRDVVENQESSFPLPRADLYENLGPASLGRVPLDAALQAQLLGHVQEDRVVEPGRDLLEGQQQDVLRQHQGCGRHPLEAAAEGVGGEVVHRHVHIDAPPQ